VLISPVRVHAEVRGLWVVRDTITSPESIRKCVAFAKEHRFNVLFVQVRGRGDAFYHSYFVPGPEGHPEIPRTFDPLEEIVRVAHENGIEVHAWFNMYFTWSAETSPSAPGHPLNEHPDWFMVSSGGQNMGAGPASDFRSDVLEGRYLSPGLEAVRSYLSRVITEVIVTYNVDGVHLDYVRYPGRDYDFHPLVRREFYMRYDIDPIDVVRGNGSVDPALVYLGKWVEFRAEQVDRQVRSIRKRLDLVDPKIRLSAAVKSHADEALYQFGQNWAAWVNEGLVDFVVTMSYYPDTNQLFDVMKTNIERTTANRIIGGVGIYMTDADVAARQIALLREMDIMGICIFSYTTFLEQPRLAGRLLDGSPETELPPEFGAYIRRVYE